MMKRLSVHGFGRVNLWFAVAGVCFALSLRLGAGEKIVFGNEQSKVNPDKKSQLSKETQKGWNKIDTDPLAGDLLYRPAPRHEGFDLKREKQRKLQRLEELNWMFVKPGELQEEEEAKAGGRDEDPSEVLAKDDDKQDLMFRGLGETKNPLSSVSGKSSGKHKASQPKQVVNDEEEDYGRNSRSLVSSKRDGQTGLRTSSESDFKKLFEPASGANTDKSDAGMASLFRPGTVSVLSREQKAMREEYRTFIAGSQGGTPGGSAASDLPKLGTASGNPLTAKAADSFTRGAGLDSYGAGLSRGVSGMDTAGKGAWNYGGVSGFGTLPPANLTPAAAPKQTAMPSLDPTRARGMGSLGGH